jgi:hypothetical protein
MPMEDVTDLTSEEPATTTELEGSMISPSPASAHSLVPTSIIVYNVTGSGKKWFIKACLYVTRLLCFTGGNCVVRR